MPNWKKRPPGSNWGEFGPNDELGRLNLLTADKVRDAIREVKEGLAFCLSLPLDLPGKRGLNPRRFPPELRPTYEDGEAFVNYRFERQDPSHNDVANDDAVLLCLQYSTQWDALAHVGQQFDADDDGKAEIVYYNGFRGGEDILGSMDSADATNPAEGTHGGAYALGIETMAASCVQGRAVMVNLYNRFGRQRKLVGYDDLMRVIDADGVEVETGDVVCFYTGYSHMILEMDGDPDVGLLSQSCAVLDGRDDSLLKWITESGIAAIAADNYGVEAIPSRPGDGLHTRLPLHEHCLFKLGLPLGELWYLKHLADWLERNGRNRFFLTAPPLRLPRAVGSPVTPIGTV